MEEPEIMFDAAGKVAAAPPNINLEQYTEDEFRLHYKCTKRQYSGLRKSIKVLMETYDALSETGPLEIDQDILSNIELLIEDFTSTLEQMHLAAEWERDKH